MYEVSSRSSIGKKHRQILFNILVKNSFKNVLEIGCFRGYSSCAFLWALDQGCDFQYTICDPHPRINLNMIEACSKKDNITIVKKPSLEVISPEFDFIFIDGDHTTQYVSLELMKLIDSNTETMFAHDTYIKDSRYRGANLYRYCFSNHKDYYYIDDPGKYGISFFTKNIDIFKTAEPLFNPKKSIKFS